MFTYEASYGFDGLFSLVELDFFFRITYYTKNIVIHTHLCLMSIVEIAQGKQHIFNNPIDFTFA